MNLFCLDTSTDYAVCAVGDDQGNLFAGSAKRHERDLSVRLYSTIKAVFADSGLSFEQMDILAVGIGPGSFTGVRVAVTTMRTLAQTTAKQLVAVGTLDIIARDALSISRDTNKDLCPILASRRNEVYAAVFHEGTMKASPFTASYSEVRQLSGQASGLTYCGNDSILRLVFPENLEGDADHNFDLIKVDHPTPLSFLQLACQEVHRQNFRDPLSLDPMYIAPPAISQHKNSVLGP